MDKFGDNKEEFEFPWNDSQLIVDAYNRENYKEINTSVKNGKALILFSGNGLYYPNTEEVFVKTIIDTDRYEFGNIGKNRILLKAFEKIVYVRDIYKQWYIAGINSELNSIDKTIDFLSQLLEGYRIVTCGISAGGYMATVAGIRLDADMIINVSGQWKLDSDNIIYKKYAKGKGDIKDYISIPHEMTKNKSNNIFYFFPAECDYDIVQYEYCKNDLDYVFAMDVNVHGALLRGETWPHLISIDKKKLIDICNKFKNKTISPELLFNIVVPFRYKVIYRIKHLGQMLLNKK